MLRKTLALLALLLLPLSARAQAFPGFDETAAMSPEARIEYLRVLRGTLAELDPHRAQTAWLERFVNGLECRAYADDEPDELPSDSPPSPTPARPPQPFCFNLGVIRPIAACKFEELGPEEMHNFDTREDLKAILGDVADCAAGEKPCSPIFGFDEGKTRCVKPNLTRACDKLSPPDDHSFSDVLKSCADTGKAKVGEKDLDCGKLKEFFDTQARQMGELCSGQGACEVAKRKLARITGAAPAPTTGDKPGEDATPSADCATPANVAPACANVSVDPHNAQTPATLARAFLALVGHGGAPDACANLRIGDALRSVGHGQYRSANGPNAAVAVPLDDAGLDVVANLLLNVTGRSGEILASVLPGKPAQNFRLPPDAKFEFNGQALPQSAPIRRLNWSAAARWVTENGSVVGFSATPTSASGNDVGFLFDPKTHKMMLFALHPAPATALTLPGAPEALQPVAPAARQNAQDLLAVARVAANQSPR